MSKKGSLDQVASTKRRPKKWKIILFSVIAFILIFAIVSFLGTKSVFDSNFGRADAPEYTGYLRYEDISGYDRIQVSFISGENKLTGYIYGEDNDKGLVVIAHGLGGGAESYLAETTSFVDNGWRVFAYDCTGSYASEGDGTKGLAQSVLDLDAALGYIGSQDWGLPIMLYGHSWGGYAVTAVLNKEHPINAAVSVAGYATPAGLLREQMQIMMGDASAIVYPFAWAYQRMLFGSAARLSAIDGINNSGIPVMIIHGTKDEMISYDGAGIIAHRDEITNPNAVYIIRDKEGQNGHNNLVYSLAASAYIAEKNTEYDALYANYDGNIPSEVKAEYYAGVDKFRTSELDAALMNEINAFFEKSLQ